MKKDYKISVEKAYQSTCELGNIGHQATYIPELAMVDGNQFGAHISTLDGDHFGSGDCETRFSIQSISKVLSLALAYKITGEKLWKRVEVEPSGTKFDSLILLETNNGIPRNPFINAGAIVVCDILISELKDANTEFLDFVRHISDIPSLTYSDDIAASEKTEGYRNVAMCNFIKSFGNIKNSPEEVLDFYFNICSLEMSCRQLAHSFLFLANNGQKIGTNEQIISRSQSKRINALMLTCGFYDESGEFAFKVGLPGKSGVGGGIVAVHPNNYSIAVWSPLLNKKGNSYKGMRFLETLTTHSEMTIF